MSCFRLEPLGGGGKINLSHVHKMTDVLFLLKVPFQNFQWQHPCPQKITFLHWFNALSRFWRLCFFLLLTGTSKAVCRNTSLYAYIWRLKGTGLHVHLLRSYTSFIACLFLLLTSCTGFTGMRNNFSWHVACGTTYYCRQKWISQFVVHSSLLFRLLRNIFRLISV